MEMEAKEFTYDVLLEDGGVMLADGTGAIDAPEAWKPDHFLVAALLRCTLQSLRYHADRAGLEASGRGEGRALVTKRAEDERYAVVEIVVSYDIALESDPGDEAGCGAAGQGRARLLRRRLADRRARVPLERERENGQRSSGAIVRPCPLSCSQ